ncbi:MAG: hypothetical protein AMXMBFR59_35060 [Rhodanobacteraceae bacterium]
MATARTSGSGAPLGAPAAAQTALAVPARAVSAAAIDVIILSFRFSDIVCLPFDSISSKVGVSRYIVTNGSVRAARFSFGQVRTKLVGIEFKAS